MDNLIALADRLDAYMSALELEYPIGRTRGFVAARESAQALRDAHQRIEKLERVREAVQERFNLTDLVQIDTTQQASASIQRLLLNTKEIREALAEVNND